MKTTIFTLALTTVFASMAFAQDRTVVTSTSSDISDNLDLTAVASIFGDSENLEDFERRLNDPKLQISNLDLNNDNQVDYLRIIESVEGNTHLIIVQSVLNRDVYQDVATIEVERDNNNQVQVQVVGDVYMYGNNYIYEPVYVSRPMIYNTFWVNDYRPYYSGWYYNYYPTYYYAWTPYPIYRYRTNIHNHINVHNHYNYVNIRRSDRAVALYNTRRSNAYERQYPTRSFASRNANVSNHYELNQSRGIRNAEPKSNVVSSTRDETPRNTLSNPVTPRTNSNVRTQSNTPRTNTTGSMTPRTNSNVSSQPTARTNTNPKTAAPRPASNVRNQVSTPRTATNNQSTMPRTNTTVRAGSSNVKTSATPQRSNSNASRAVPSGTTARPQSNSAGTPQTGNTGSRGNGSQRNAAKR